MRKVVLFAIIVVLIAGAAGLGIYYWLHQEFVEPQPEVSSMRFTVEPGASVRSVLHDLAAQGAIEDARGLELYLRLRGRRPTIKAGEYEIPAQASPAKILDLLESGRVVLEQLTVIEGTTFADLRRALESHPAVTQTLQGKSDEEVMAAIGRPDEHPEGRFFPDTYRFAARTTDIDILKLAYDRMERELANAWAQREPDLPVSTPYEALILASIVEKETGLPSERWLVAGVYTTRLRKGMRLQADPTVIYGIGESYDGDIRSRDLTTDTPYNTYTRTGLPPTPIAMPGRDSLLATVQPDEKGYVYFVATGEGDGSHVFSATLEEHNRAVQRYLARLRSQRAAARRQAAQAERAAEDSRGTP